MALNLYGLKVIDFHSHFPIQRSGPNTWRQRLVDQFGEERAQVMHIGPYSEEGPTIQLLHDYIMEQGYRMRGDHHEIYMSDPRRSKPEKLKTIIRHPIEKR